ncbi:hypothetical protein [Micromonospora sp. NBC_00858]|uniref:hypothetical protein n=1 Tax=Micromonospora sp. NBC_00858 TaxID=2975979 RepID=UPI00386A5529|nr:hypothetical protein OG990_23920 [Micromonospora sp. NBC_00858]
MARGTSGSLRRRPINAAGEYASVEVVESFEAALGVIESSYIDMIILDIRDQGAVAAAEGISVAVGDDATLADKGLSVFKEMRQRRFIPIVFYSAVAHLAKALHQPPFVTVVSKLDGGDTVLRDRIRDVFDSGLPTLNQALARHVEESLRTFMIDFVEKEWSELGDPARRPDLAYLMVRRLARSLDSGMIPELAAETAVAAHGKVHPTRLYVMPPVGDLVTGDLLFSDEGGWFVLLTPACDLVDRGGGKRKAEFVVLAQCLPLTEAAEYASWCEAGRPETFKALDSLIANNRLQYQKDRYFFLPGAWQHPDLIVDLQRLAHRPFGDLHDLRRLATLDDPYAQSLVAQLGRYLGRMGTPDLDVVSVRKRIPSANSAADVPVQADRRSPEPREAGG